MEQVGKSSRFVAGWVVIMLGVLATPILGGTAAAQRPSLPTRPTTPQTVGSVSADSGWTLVPASDWRTQSPGLVGSRVEVSGNLSTQLMINRRSSFSNTGWMTDAGNKKLATVLFDQIDDEQIAWMRKNRCSETCAGVFVRGVVVSGGGSRAPILRMIDVSFESRAGGVAASMVQLDSAHGDTPAVEKQLLPPGGVPTTRDLNRQKGMIPGSERPANFDTYYRSIRDTRLSKVFVNYPWNTGRNAWPRVALVVEEAPTGGTGALGYMRGGDKIKDRCWRLRARLWTGPAASQDIAPFNWCLSEMRFNVPYDDVALWGMTPATSMAEHNTGPDRTLGPNPPYLAAPRFHYADGSHGDTIMLGNILLDMSFGLGVPDGRVWVADGAKDSFTGVATGVASDTTTRTATTRTATSETKSGASQAIDSNTKDTKESLPLFAQTAKPPSLKEQLEARYPPGTVLAIQNEGILGVVPTSARTCPASYQGGKLSPDASCTAQVKNSSRLLNVGEKVYPSKIQVNLAEEKISFGIVECDSCNKVAKSSNKSQIDFQFGKGYLEEASVPAVEDVISEVLSIDEGGEQQPQQAQGSPAVQGQQGEAPDEVLTNSDVVKMAKAKLGDGIIIGTIKTTACNFDTSVNAMVKLKEAGVSDRVIQTMRDAKAAVNEPAPATSPEPQQGEAPAAAPVPGQVSFSVRHRHSKAAGWIMEGAQTEYYCSGTLSVSTDGTVTYDCAQTEDPSGRCEHVSFAPRSLKDVKVGTGGNLHLASKTRGNFDFYGSRDDIKQAQAAIGPAIAPLIPSDDHPTLKRR
jgi:hypothetical protein